MPGRTKDYNKTIYYWTNTELQNFYLSPPFFVKFSKKKSSKCSRYLKVVYEEKKIQDLPDAWGFFIREKQHSQRHCLVNNPLLMLPKMNASMIQWVIP